MIIPIRSFICTHAHTYIYTPSEFFFNYYLLQKRANPYKH